MAALSGLIRSAARPRGGISTVRLIPAGDLAGVAGMATGTGTRTRTGTGTGTGAATVPVASIVSAIEASGASYVFREDGARYSETLTGGPQQPLVRHTLVMEFPSGRSADDSGESADDAVDELLARSPEGFVALVSRASGERLLVGYSERFGTRYPLRVAALSSASGSVPADLPTLTLTLESCDATTSFKMNQL